MALEHYAEAQYEDTDVGHGKFERLNAFLRPDYIRNFRTSPFLRIVPASSVYSTSLLGYGMRLFNDDSICARGCIARP